MSVESIPVELSVVLGSCRMSIREAIAFKRSSPIVLDPSADDSVEILANGRLIARGRVVVKGDRILIEVLDRLKATNPTQQAA
jgi:flagellar motor switch protein FliN